MNKISLILFTTVILVSSAFAIDNLSRFKGQSLNQGGTTDTNGSTVIESGSSTNVFKQIVVTATVTGALTVSTNTYTTAFIATPTAVRGVLSGANGTQTTNLWSVGATVSTTQLIVSGLSTNASTGVNNLPFIVYGYTRTGKFE